MGLSGEIKRAVCINCTESFGCVKVRQHLQDYDILTCLGLLRNFQLLNYFGHQLSVSSLKSFKKFLCGSVFCEGIWSRLKHSQVRVKKLIGVLIKNLGAVLAT